MIQNPAANPQVEKPAAKYEQVADLLRQDILDGRYTVGGRLPPVRELSRRFATTPPTALRAIQMLAREGSVVSAAGPKGTRVVRDTPPTQARPTTLACLLRPHRPRNEDDNFAADMLQGVRDEVSAHRYRFVYHCMDESGYVDRREHLISEEWVCGVLLDERTPLAEIEILAGMGPPTVIINRLVDLPGLSCVAADYERIGRDSARMMLRKGYARLAYSSLAAFATGGDAAAAQRSYPSSAMLRSFQAAAQAWGALAEPIVERSAPVKAPPEFFGLPRRKPADWRPLGILANTGRRAVCILDAIAQTDLVLGRDVGGVGCYDLPCGRRHGQPPSTWAVDPAAIGAAGVSQLIGQIEDPGVAPGMTRIPVEFVDRGTF